MQKYGTARVYRLPEPWGAGPTRPPRFALGYRGARALNVTERIAQGKYRGVRGVRPIIPHNAEQVEPSNALQAALQ